MSSDEEEFDSQPQDELSQIKYRHMQERREAIEEPVEEPQPGPSTTGSASEKKGLSPSEWGERLGILTRSLDEGEPIVLHCFENIPSDFSDMEETE